MFKMLGELKSNEIIKVIGQFIGYLAQSLEGLFSGRLHQVLHAYI